MYQLEKIKSFFNNQSKNYIVLVIFAVVDTFLISLVNNFNNLYIVALGSTPLQLGKILAIGSLISTIISIPFGWLSDMYSLKRVFLFGLIIQLVSVFFYAFAQNLIWIIYALIFATLTTTLVKRTQMIYIANNLSDLNRAIGFGIRTTIMGIFSIFAPIIGGILVNFWGGISVEGIRPLYFIQLLGYSSIIIYLAITLKEIKIKREKREPKNIIGDIKDVFNSGKYLRRFAFMRAMSMITFGMSMPYSFIYSVDFKGASSMTIGYMGTCLVLVSMLLAIPLGYLADNRGRKFVIFLSRPFFWLSNIILILSPKGVVWPLLFAWSLRGVEMAHMCGTTMSMEIVPTEYRGRWTGILSFLQNLVRIMAMILGGYIYGVINPNLVFIIPVIIDAFIIMPILFTIPDTLKKQSGARE